MTCDEGCPPAAAKVFNTADLRTVTEMTLPRAERPREHRPTQERTGQAADQAFRTTGTSILLLAGDFGGDDSADAVDLRALGLDDGPDSALDTLLHAAVDSVVDPRDENGEEDGASEDSGDRT